MLTVAVMAFLLLAAGLAAMGAKYAFGPAPADYHARILRRGGAEIPADVTRVIKALYVVMGASLMALAALLAMLAVFGVWSDQFWAKAAALLAVLIVGLPALAVTRRVQAETGVTTPVRPTAALLGTGALAFVLSVI